jgi:zinc protease
MQSRVKLSLRWTGLVAMMVCVTLADAFAFPKIQEVSSSSGVRAWLMEDHSLPLISVRGAVTHAGFAYAPEGQDGVAMMVAELLTEGAGDMDYQQFHAALDADGIRMQVDAGVDDLVFAVDTVSSQSEHAFTLLGLALGKPRIDSEAVERLRRNVLAQQALMNAKPEYVADRAFRQAAFYGHPYARTGDGDAQSIKTLGRSDIALFAREHIAQDRLVVAVAGDITPQQLQQMLDIMAVQLPREAEASKTSVIDVTMPAQANNVTQHVDVPQTAVVFGLPAIKRNHPDFYAAYVMNYVLGGEGLNSRLSQAIRERSGLSYYVYAGLQVDDASGIIRGGFASRTNQVDSAVTLLKKELQLAQAHGFTQKELDAAKKYITGSFPLALDSGKNLAKYMLMMQLQGLGKDYLEQRNALIAGVTLDQLNRVAAQLLDVNKLLVVRAGQASVSENDKP